jgi:glycine/D-amino acid oxidase-like deaminating enzyme
MDTAKRPREAPLEHNTKADVCVVGAGIAGLTTAYLLASGGRSVVVLDSGSVGGGQTERTTAHLGNAIDDRYTEIERLHGAQGAVLAAQSHSAAIAKIEEIAHAEGISCHFERLDGYLFLAPDQGEDLLRQEGEACRRAGLEDAASSTGTRPRRPGTARATARASTARAR